MFEKIIPIMESAAKVGLFGHTHPDGDAMGSCYALSLALRSLGKQTKVFLLDDYEVHAHKLIVPGDEPNITPEDCDLLIALDCGDSKRLEKYEQMFLNHGNTIAIDHHITHVKFAKSGTVVADVSSTCELIYFLLKEMNISLTKDIASNLYIGLTTDTGNFKYSSVTGDTLRAAADVIDTGIDFSDMARVLFSTKSIGYYSLMQIALDKLQILCDGRAAVIYLSDDDFQSSGISEDEASAIVNIPGSIEGVEVGAYIRKRGDSEYKVSLRSNYYVDVAELAAYFGGGGHVHASGYSVFDKGIDGIITELTKELDKRWQE